MEKRSDTLARLLKAGLNSVATIEAKTGPLIDDEIGAIVGLAGASLQRYRTGAIPEQRLAAIFAETCVTRGLMSRTWLERFLKAAHYPTHERARSLAACFLTRCDQRAPPLSGPICRRPANARFVMRRDAFDAVLAGLNSELSTTLVVSFGGMGKTSLARAVASACFEGRAGMPRFAAVVWASDQDRLAPPI